MNGKSGSSTQLGNLSDPANVMKVSKYLSTEGEYHGFYLNKDGVKVALNQIHPRMKTNGVLDDFSQDFKTLTGQEYRVDKTTFPSTKK